MTMASENFHRFMEEFFSEREVQDLVDDLREQSYDERDRNPNARSPVVFKSTQTRTAIIDSTSLYLNWRMQRKNKADLGRPNQPDYKLIKWVCAHSMVTGVGTFTVHDPYAEALKRRHAQGIKQYVFSQVASAFVDNHRQLLEFSSAGNLTPYITGYFNPQMYNPNDEMTYVAIAQITGYPPSQVMLFTTNIQECQAAAKAGVVAIKVKRPGDDKNRTYPRIKDMSAIEFRPFPPESPLPPSLVPESKKSDVGSEAPPPMSSAPHSVPVPVEQPDDQVASETENKSPKKKEPSEKEPKKKESEKVPEKELGKKEKSVISMGSTFSCSSKTSEKKGPPNPIISNEIKTTSSGMAMSKAVPRTPSNSPASKSSESKTVTPKVTPSKRSNTSASSSSNNNASKKTESKAKGSGDKKATKRKDDKNKKTTKKSPEKKAKRTEPIQAKSQPPVSVSTPTSAGKTALPGRPPLRSPTSSSSGPGSPA